MDLDFLRDQRVVIAAACGALALFAIIGVSLGLMARRHLPAPALAESSAPKTLQVEMGHEDGGLDASRPLRCFVGGQFVGMVSLGECAKKNGVPQGGLDVGLDTTGAVAAATSDGSVLQPLPGAPVPPAQAGPRATPTADGLPATPLSAPPSATAACWSFAGGDWRKLADQMTLDSCVQALFAGHCEAPGSADYGRWSGDTLRLITGRVELASDNRSFHTLVKQSADGCAIPNLAE